MIETKIIVGRIKKAPLERLDIGKSHKRWPHRIIGHLVWKKIAQRKSWTFCEEKNLGGERLDIGQSYKRWFLRIIGHLVGKKN